MTLEVHNMLVLSTGHLRLETAQTLPDSLEQMLKENPPIWWPSFVRAEGWLFTVPDSEAWQDDRYHDAPEDLRAAITFARVHGCAWLMFDQDGPVIGDLPHWSW